MQAWCEQCSRYQATVSKRTSGPFIQGKIKRELDHLYEPALSKTKTARINCSRLISVLDSFSCE